MARDDVGGRFRRRPDDTMDWVFEYPSEPNPAVEQVIQTTGAILALTAAIWHNQKTGQPTLRSLVASDH